MVLEGGAPERAGNRVSDRSLIAGARSTNLARRHFPRIDMPDRETTPRNFESALAEFETLVEKMERGDLSLEDSVSAYERGVALHRYCEQALSTAERKIRILTAGAGDGGAEEALLPFDSESGDARASRQGGVAPSHPEPALAPPSSRDEEEDGPP